MRDLTRTGFDSNSPLRNYIKLSERIEEIQSRLRQQDQMLIDLTVKINKLV